MAPTQKSILITGGASGIGLALTRHFASQGHIVAILDIDTTGGPTTAASVATDFPNSTVSFHHCDVSSWDAQASVFKHVFHQHGGRLDIVMANAGVPEPGLPTDMYLTEEEEPSTPGLKVLDVNLLGCVYSVKLAIHYMNKEKPAGDRRGGSIVCTASNAGLYPFPIAPLYGASKAGVVNLVRSLGPVLERVNIQINALAPAVLDTNIQPDKSFFEKMVVTPMSTLIRGVACFMDDPSLTGMAAEIHGDRVTFRPPHEYVDEDSRRNMETFAKLAFE